MTGEQGRLVGDTLPIQVDTFEIPRAHARYRIEWAMGCETNPEIAFRAQQIQGESYVESHYFSADGLDEYGRLVAELDGTREQPGVCVSISYLLAVPNDEQTQDAIAAMRLIDIPEGGSIEDIPTYKYFKESISLDVQQQLHQVIQHHGREGIREIAALAAVGRIGHFGSYELMRAVIQNSIIKKSEGRGSEIYITALTDKSLKPILEFAGTSASVVIGKPVRIFADEPRAKEDLRVTPVLVDPHKIIDGLVAEIEDPTNTRVSSLETKLLFLTDGLTERQMGPHVSRLVGEIIAKHKQ